VTDNTRAAAFATPVFLVPPVGAAVKNVATATTTLVKTGPGTLLGVSINTGGAGSDFKVYDGLDATGTLLGTFSSAAQGVINLPGGGINFLVGLCVVTENGTPANITISYV